MKKVLVSIHLWILLMGVTPALAIEIEWQKEPVSIEHDWGQFMRSFEPHMIAPDHLLNYRGRGWVPYYEAYLRIAPVAEIDNTLVLVFNYPSAMNAAMLRASIFVEGLETFWDKTEPIFVNGRPIIRNRALAKFIGINVIGHDLQAKDLLTYWKALDQVKKRHLKPVPTSKYDELLPIEEDVRSVLEPYFHKNPDTALVIVSANYYDTEIFSHEVSHAQYFTNPEYKKAVHDYWNSMSEADRETARKELSNSFARYDGNNEDLMINEFQAHLTGVNIDSDMNTTLSPLFDPHFSLLRAHLYNQIKGARFIEIPNPEGRKRSPLCSKYLLAPRNR